MALSHSAGAQFYVTAAQFGRGGKALELFLLRVGHSVDWPLWHWTGTDMQEASKLLMNAIRVAVLPTAADVAPVVAPSPPAPAPPAAMSMPLPPLSAPPPKVKVQVEPTSSPVVKVDVVPLPVKAPQAVVVQPSASLPAAVSATSKLSDTAPAPTTDEFFSGDVVASDHAPTDEIETDRHDHVSIGDAARKMLNEAGMDMQQTNLYAAIDAFRQAVNLNPYATSIRLKLAGAYLQAGYPALAVDEARRAMMLDPGNKDLNDFIKGMRDHGLIAAGDPTVLLASLSRDANNTQTWLALGDSYMADKQTSKAKDAYEHAVALQPEMPDAQVKLIGLFLTEGQCDKAVAAYTKAGATSYAPTVHIINDAANSLLNAIHRAATDHDAGLITREGYYRQATDADSTAKSLQAFVTQMSAPDAQKIGYLHLAMAVQLVSQVTGAWVSFIETNDDQYKAQADPLEQDARRELKTAIVATIAEAGMNASPVH